MIHSSDISLDESTKDTYEIDVHAGMQTDDDFPDGGFIAWLIVCGAMCNTFATFGYVSSWGVFQSYYQETILKDSSPSSMIYPYALVFFPGLIVGRCFDLGYFRSVFLISSLLIVGTTFLIPQCEEYWQFLICQGVMLGIGCGGVFSPTPAVIAHWFKRRRGFAMGFVAAGASIGGTILPVTARNLLPQVGFAWTMRIFGFMLLIVLGVANLLLRRRLPPVDVNGDIFKLNVFRSAPYSVYCTSALLTFLGIYTLLTYVGTTAISVGISSDYAFYLVAIANASSLFGRFCAGGLSDRIGSLNVMIPFTAVAGILTYTWPFARSKVALIAITVVYGFSSGAYLSLLSNPLLEMGNSMDDIGTRVGMFMTIMAMGALVGPPISGAIANTTEGNFKLVGYYAGTCILAGVGLMCVTRNLVFRSIVQKG